MLITFANSKGGVGKSTLAVHLALWLFDRGCSVALVDADRQRSSSVWAAEAEPGLAVLTPHTPDDIVEAIQALRPSHEFIVADAPGGLEDVSRTLLLLSDLAVFPVQPSILDLRSVAEATKLLKYAQSINSGRPEASLVLSRVRKRDRISAELVDTAPTLGLSVAKTTIRELTAFRWAAQRGTVVARMGSAHRDAAEEINQLFVELLGGKIEIDEPLGKAAGIK